MLLRQSPGFLQGDSEVRRSHEEHSDVRTSIPDFQKPALLFPLVVLQIGKEQLKPVAEGPHIRIHDFLELESVRYHLDGPMLCLGMLTGFKAEQEIAWMLRINAEVVDGTLRIGLRVRHQPALCVKLGTALVNKAAVVSTHQSPPCSDFDISHEASSRPLF